MLGKNGREINGTCSASKARRVRFFKTEATAIEKPGIGRGK
jgi:hypothetical protein